MGTSHRRDHVRDTARPPRDSGLLGNYAGFRAAADWIRGWRPSRYGARRRFAVVAFGGQLAFAAVTFAGSVVLARSLGPSGKGEFTTWSLVALLASLVGGLSISTGFGRAFLKGLSGELSRRAALHAAFAAAPVLAVVGPLVVAGVVRPGLAAMLTMAVPAGVMTKDLLTVMQAAKWPWAFQLTRIATAVVFSVGMIALVVTIGANLTGAYLLWGAATVVGAMIAVKGVSARTANPDGRAPNLAGLQRLGEHAFVANLSDWFLLRLDQLITGVILGPMALGIYSVAVNWSEVSQYLGHSIGQAVFEDERTLDRRQIRRVLALALGAVTPMTIASLAAGWLLIVPVFGAAFETARWPLLILGPGVIARSLGFTATQILLARGLGRVASRIMLVVLGLGVVGWIAGGLSFGVYGVAATSTVVYSVYAMLVIDYLMRASG
jgi:O-antigen/teichoic acid export membrane protein